MDALSVDVNLQVMRASMGVVIVGWDFLEAQISVKSSRCFHVIQCVEQHASVTRHACFVQNRFRQLPSKAQPTKSLTNEQSLHLCRIGVVSSIQGPQRAAPRHGAIDFGKQERTSGLRIVARQMGELFIKPLKAQIHIQALRVLCKDDPSLAPVIRADRCEQSNGMRIQGR